MTMDQTSERDTRWVHDPQVPSPLPSVLTLADGRTIASREDWEQLGRPAAIDALKAHVYGREPAAAWRLASVETLERDAAALDGRATRVQVRLHIEGPHGSWALPVLAYLPPEASGPVPVFAGLNFYGSHTVRADATIALPRGWVPNNEKIPTDGHRASEAGRGAAATRWSVEQIVASGFGVATAYCGDLCPDHPDGLAEGIDTVLSAPASPPRSEEHWGAIGVWAFGLSRVVDWLMREPGVDAQRIAVMGHSRLGKAALWAAAQDTRMSLAISNQSGCGGASLSRRHHGERLSDITSRFPHWFCRRFESYVDREDQLPIDQHHLLAAIAPRPLLVNSAIEDQWADPLGSYLALVHATPIYRLLGRTGPTDHDAHDRNGPPWATAAHHLRQGRHSVTAEDWALFMAFAKAHGW